MSLSGPVRRSLFFKNVEIEQGKSKEAYLLSTLFEVKQEERREACLGKLHIA